MFCRLSLFKRAIRSISLRMFNLIENNGISDFEKNGEKAFITSLFDNFSKKKENERVIFDVGGNVGDYSQILTELSSSKKIKTIIHIFEPTKACFEVLSSKFSCQKVILNNVGLSNTPADVLIFYDNEKSGLASLYKRNLTHYNMQMSLSETVRVVAASDYIEQNHINHIDFVKIDIEGHELEAFKGFGDYLSGGFIDFIQFEYGGSNLDSRTSLMELFSYLENRGFLVSKVMPKGLEIRSYKLYMENYNYANYVAISKKVI
jgi:FkbM family methyltransferase